MVNQRADEGHEQKTITFDADTTVKVAGRVTKGDQASTGRGYSQFISHSNLQYDKSKNTEYLKNNSVEFRLKEVKL